MTERRGTLGAEYFETMFRETDDPWDLESSAYEQGKFQDSVDALSGRPYAQGFEIGCAKGVLTEKLAMLCSPLTSIDISETALAAARRRNRQSGHVTFERMAFPQQAPQGKFDLIILSEVAYYWDDKDLARTADWLGQHLNEGGDLLLVHYVGETDYPQSGDDAVAKLFAMIGFPVDVVQAHRRPRYRLDLWRRRG